MVANGIIFFPPSELVYFDAYFSLNGSLGPAYVALPLANGLGHFILYEISRRYGHKLATIENVEPGDMTSVALRYVLRLSRNYFRLHDERAGAVLYGRCVPVVHTGISIVAGVAGVSRMRFMALTVIGNMIFSGVCWLIIDLLSNRADYSHSIVFVAAFFVGVYLLHIVIEQYFFRGKRDE